MNNKKDMTPLFDTILDYIPAPEGDPDANTQVLISTIDYNEYVGRIGIGKVDNGCLKVNQEAVVVNHHEPDKQKRVRISKLYEFDGLNKVDVTEAKIGSIVAISGIADIHIGDTICAPENPVAIPFQKISEPTLSMNFIVNDSPLAGQEGKFVTSRHLRDRLFRELNTDVSLRVEETDSPDSYKVSGRGELHLSVLIENMRREGYEFAVSKAEVQAIIEEGTNPLLMQTPFRNPQTGAFDKDMLKKFLVDYAHLDASKMPAQYVEYYQKMGAFWNFIEKTLIQSTLAEKYQNLIAKSLISNPVAAEDAFTSRTEQSDVLLAAIPYSSISDSTIKQRNQRSV